MTAKYLTLKVMRLTCGQLPVVIGAAPACQLSAISFADVLDESADRGYQRAIDGNHARDFRAYIERPGATTIPLTFNLRGAEGDGWRIEHCEDGETAVLEVRLPSEGVPPILAQVDCQHRLGAMSDSSIPLTFQCFLGLDQRAEMAIFNVINGKAKGLSSSLLDYHITKLSPGIEMVRLDLYIAKTLHDDQESVWFGKVKLGGTTSQGSQRRISLRGLQTATKLLLNRGPLGSAAELSPLEKYQIVRDFWTAVTSVWPVPWNQPRSHLLTKGVGVTALSLLAGDIITAVLSRRQQANIETFSEYLSSLRDLNWSNGGPFKGYGGRHGANEIHQVMAGRLFAPGLATVRAAK